MEKVALGLAAALVGAISGAAITYWRTRYTVKSQDFSKRIEELNDSISKLEEISCQHWGKVGKSDPIQTSYIIGAKSKVSLLVAYLDSAYSEFDRSSISDKLAAFFRACTGGSFGSCTVAVEPERQREILITGEELKIELMKTRNKLY